MRFVIQRTEEGVTTYFSASAGRNLGAGGQGGWISEHDKALSFARLRDTEEFIEVYLPHVGPFCTPTRIGSAAEEADA